MSRNVRILLTVVVVVLLHAQIGLCQSGDGKEVYDTGVAALSRGYLEIALRCFRMVTDDSPNSVYAPAACAMAVAIYLGEARGCSLVADVLTEGSGKAAVGQKQQFLAAGGALSTERANLVAGLATVYDAFRQRFAETTIMLQLDFPDIAKNLEPVREDLASLQSGTWIPMLLLGGLEDQVKMLSVYTDLLVMSGVDLDEQPLEEWLGLPAPIERLLVREAFFYRVGALLVEEGQRELAIDALQRVLRATEYEPSSKLRADASALLASMGAKPAPPQGPSQPAPQTASPATPPAGVSSVLFDETRPIARPTGENAFSLSGTDWFGCSDLQALLRSSGFATAALRTELITIQDLADYDVFAVLATDHNRAYSLIEVWAILLYVEQGGGLLLCESTWDGKQAREFTIGAVARFFDVDFVGNGMIREPQESGGLGVITIPDLTPHPVTQGVSRLTTVETAFMAATGRSQVLAKSSSTSWFDDSSLPQRGVWEAGEPTGPLAVLAVLEYGKGRVAFLGDGMLFTNGFLSEADNRRLAQNLFQWLSDAP